MVYKGISGESKCQAYVSEKDKPSFKNHFLLENLKKALKGNEFLLYYQPQLELGTGRIRGVEALLRWFSPQGLVSPADFIPLAEYSGLIVPIGEWVMRNACAQNRSWQENRCEDLVMSVNVSAKEFYEPDFVSAVEGILYDTGLDPKLLNIEITESFALKDFIFASQTIQKLKNLGLSITVDDFGTGYSSLNYLANLDLDYLKIDKLLIQNLDTHGRKNSVVKGIINIAHDLGIKVIAEGVEKQEELDFLKKHRCDMAQGFHIGYPLPVQENL